MRAGLRDLARLESGEGLVGTPREIALPVRPPGLSVFVASGRDALLDSELLGAPPDLRDGGGTAKTHTGTGRSRTEADARFISQAEVLERYASCIWAGKEHCRGTARELVGRHLPVETWPRCSDAEYRHPKSDLVSPTEDVSTTWVRGVDLADLEPTWVPAAMALLNYSPRDRRERVHYPISTGCAVHQTLPDALLGALCEVIERDSLGLTWLQRLPLPPLDSSILDDESRDLIELKRRHWITTHLFDATTDAGVPAVYSLDIAAHSREGAQFVGAACHPDPTQAARKALLEQLVGRSWLSAESDLPEDAADFRDVMHGAHYMAHAERAHAFEFLLAGESERLPSAPQRVPGETAAERVRWIVARLQALGMHVIAVDLGSRELDLMGLRGVRVIVPELQPISFRPVNQYRAHRRLLNAPAAMGLRARDTTGLSPWPQPFA